MWFQSEGERQGRQFMFTMEHSYTKLAVVLGFAACILAIAVPLIAQSTSNTGKVHELLYIVD